MIRQALQQLLQNPTRAALTGFSVLLGVAFIAGAFVLGDMVNRAFDDVFASANRGVDARVQPLDADDERGVPVGLVPQVRQVDGVAEAQGVLFVDGVAVVSDGGDLVGTSGAPRFGGNWIDSDALNPFSLLEGSAPDAPGEVVLDEDTASDGGYAVGDTVRISANGPVDGYELVGISRFGENGGLGGATVAHFDPATAPSILDAEGQLSSISVAAEPGVTQAALARNIGITIPEDLEALTGEQAIAADASDVQAGVSIFRNILLGFAAIAMVVAAFVIFNTFSITVAQRTRQLGLLRAVGATRRQVRRLVTVEAAIIGLVASALGVLAGLGLAVGLLGLFSLVGLDLPAASPALAPRTIVISMVVGVLASVLAALIPARRAGRVSPAAAMRTQQAGRESLGLRARAMGIVVPALGFAGFLGALNAGLPLEVTVLALAVSILVVFAGISLFLGTIARTATGLLGLPFRRSVSGRLAAENAGRSPRRTASAATALTIGIALIGFFTIFAASLNASLDDTIQRQFRVDYVAVADDSVEELPDGLAETLVDDPEIGTVTRWRYAEFYLPDTANGGLESRELFATDPEGFTEVYDPNIVAGDPEGLRGGGSVFVHTDAAEDLGLAVGDPFEMTFIEGADERRQLDLTVAAIYDEGTFGEYFIAVDDLASVDPGAGDTVVLANAAGGEVTPASDATIDQIAEAFPLASLQTTQEYQDQIAGELNQLLTVIYAMLGLAIVIAGFGIANTIALGIVERTGEIGLLRSVGMTRRQVVRMVRVESILVATLGGLVGIGSGIALALLLLGRLDEEVSVVSVPPLPLAAVVGLCVVLGALAAILPARRAARLDVLRAVQAD